MKQERQSEMNEKSPAEPVNALSRNEDSDRSPQNDVSFEVPNLAVPVALAGSGSLDRLVDTAKEYARQATSDNTNAAYKADWAHFSSWCRRRGTEPLSGVPCPDPQLIGLYIANCASPDHGAPALSVSTIERRLSGLVWHYQQRGFTLDRKNRHIATVLAGIKRKHARPPLQKEAVLYQRPKDLTLCAFHGEFEVIQ